MRLLDLVALREPELGSFVLRPGRLVLKQSRNHSRYPKMMTIPVCRSEPWQGFSQTLQ